MSLATVNSPREAAIVIHVGRYRARIDEAPAIPLDLAADAVIRRQHRHREATLRPVPRHIEKPDEVDMFRPEIVRALEFDVLAPVFPGRDRRETPLLSAIRGIGGERP